MLEQMASGNLGEQLQAARKAKDLTLKQVEEETKIRVDFLEAFERNEFDFDLPDIYRRGFLRTYAQFLGLDAGKFINRIPVSREKHAAETSGREKGGESAEGDGGEQDPLQSSIFGRMRECLSRLWKFSAAKAKERKWQVGAVVVVVCVLAFFLWPSSKSDLEWDELLSGVPTEVLSVGENQPKKMTILATNSVKILVRSKGSRAKIFSGTVNAGESEEFEYSGDVQISFSDGNALSIKRGDGSVLRPKKQGAGWMEIAY
ncbi:MAG: helix-turn-helix domain-containing protein [Puniceicoccales bacterium]|jgi:transcriptional regulator with XRE-family HTH domain|nr:helix-turn-helix domain-containing protein [Puniceicoccales bacterium]